MTVPASRSGMESSGSTYAGAGVDIEAGERAVHRIADAVGSTMRPGVVGGIGGFGGLFDPVAAGRAGQLLVATTDGVGTKAEVAAATGRYDTIGLDLVAMCVDDLVCQGAEPLFMLDYLLVGRLVPEMAQALVSGIAAGCRIAGCALLGGEMAEHPGVLPDGQFDLAGFAVGAVPADRLIDGSAAQPGDLLVGVSSPNLRSNGFSLARRVLLDVAGRPLDGPAWTGSDRTLADELLDPSLIYAPAVLAAIAAGGVHAVAHITGGGLPGNLPRVLPDTLTARVDPARWRRPRIMDEIAAVGRVVDDEMYRVFNMGLGMVLAVSPDAAPGIVALLQDAAHDAAVVGELIPGTGNVEILR